METDGAIDQSIAFLSLLTHAQEGRVSSQTCRARWSGLLQLNLLKKHRSEGQRVTTSVRVGGFVSEDETRSERA